MEIHYIAYYFLLSIAALGAIFAPSVRNMCIAMLILSVGGYGLSLMLGHYLDTSIYLDSGEKYIVHRDGFVRALIDVYIGTSFSSIFKKNIPAALIGLAFGFSAYAHVSMTLAIIDNKDNFFYTNYETIIAITSLIQAILLFGGKISDVYRHVTDSTNTLSNSWRGGKTNRSNKDLP